MNGFQQIMLDSLGKSKTGGKMEDKNQGREREGGEKTEKLMEVERLED